jgi:predicted glycoside hydrolase/deacetylase ChbG (UPF0249 family)
MCKTIRHFLFLILAFPMVVSSASSDDLPQAEESPTRLIIRMDDPGFCHATNMAVKKIIDEDGAFSSISVIVTTPWIDELAEMLRQHPDVCVGVHLVLNSEWNEFRWGPVLPASEVPSLVNADGKFFGSRSELMAHEPKAEEMAREIRAQIELALKKGLNISYVDYHMGAALSAQEFQAELEKAALDYHLGISRYYGEDDVSNVYRVDPENKLEEGIKILNNLNPEALNLFVAHPGMDTPEMAAMTDINVFGLKEMSKHRQAVTDMLCHPDFKAALERNNIQIIDYNDLRAEGLHKMRRPRVSPPLAELIEKGKLKDREQQIEDPYGAPDTKKKP